MPIPDSATATASASVRRLFAQRAYRVPGTRLGSIAYPAPRGPQLHWHYWWQAHYLDCLLDEHLRSPGGDALAEAHRLARGIWLRNGARWRNSYYDDMAWLALALQRLDAVEARRRPRYGVRTLGAALESALESAHTADLGGGVYWNTRRDYKNTASTAPSALFFARAGDPARAQELLDWLRDRVQDPGTGLYLDGVTADGRVERGVYTYNQGTVLGALVALGGRENLALAGSLIDAVARHLGDGNGVLPLDHRGDGGLFTGILARYLAVAAETPGIDAGAASTARVLLGTTADHLWTQRLQMDGGAALFPPPQDGPVSLSSQVQAWMVLEAERVCRRRSG